MDESILESSLGTLDLSDQQQPASQYPSSTAEFNQALLVDDLAIVTFTDPIDDSIASLLDSHDTSDHFNINDIINPPNDSFPGNFDTQLSFIPIDADELTSLLECIPKEEPAERDNGSLEQQQQSQLYQSEFVESYDSLNFYPPVQSNVSAYSVAVGSSPLEPQVQESLQTVLRQQNQILHESSRKKNQKGQKTSKVGPANYVLHSGGCQPCTTVEMHNDYAHQQEQFFEYNATYSKKIQIHCQPRSKFRPRTQNESKLSSHYLRCEEQVKPEYPTIGIHQHWFFESDVNLIEVALMGVDHLPHLYKLDNKNSSDTYEDNALIFKQNDPHVLYFRLTNEDFQNGYKTFLMELIKSKQDERITKEIIRTRQLEQSMLRFTRIFQVGKGNFQRDEGSTEFSTIMTEAYGDVEVEHMDPQYGPMSGQKMVYIVLKGRILKNDLHIEVSEPSTGWRYTVDSFTKNGNVLYFRMPAFPYPNPQYETVKVYVTVCYKNDEIYQAPYLYIGTLDHYLAQLTIDEPGSTRTSFSSGSNSFDALDFLNATSARSNTSPRRSSTPKVAKRLWKKNL